MHYAPVPKGYEALVKIQLSNADISGSYWEDDELVLPEGTFLEEIDLSNKELGGVSQYSYTFRGEPLWFRNTVSKAQACFRDGV